MLARILAHIRKELLMQLRSAAEGHDDRYCEDHKGFAGLCSACRGVIGAVAPRPTGPQALVLILRGMAISGLLPSKEAA